MELELHDKHWKNSHVRLKTIGNGVLLTFRGALVLVIPHHQQFSQAGHLGDFCDDPEKTLDAIVGQHHSREARRPRRDQRQEEGAVHTGPLLRETRDREKWQNIVSAQCRFHLSGRKRMQSARVSIQQQFPVTFFFSQPLYEHVCLQYHH